MKRIHIKFNTLGEGKMDCKDLGTFRCLGQKGLKYPEDLSIDPKVSGTKTNPYFSQTYSCGERNGDPRAPCQMNFAILIWGQNGVYIHEWPNPATYEGNGGPTHGCIHLEVGDAKKVYNWVDQKTRITIEYPW